MVDPVITPTLIGGGLMGASTLLGGMSAKKSQKRAQAAIAQAIADLEKIGIPSVEAQQILMDNPQYIGDLINEMEQAEDLGNTAYEGINVPGEYKDAQLEALRGLETRSRLGLTPEDEMELKRIRRDVARQDEARRESALMDAQTRGAGNSGLVMANMFDSSQDAAQRASEESDRRAAMAFQNKMTALKDLGEYGSGLRDQEYNEQSNLATARDRISEFNRNNRNQINQRNVSSKNSANQFNLENKQALEGVRSSNMNDQKKYNSGLIQQKFDNEMRKYGAMANARTGQSNMYQNQASNQGASAGQLTGGIGQLYESWLANRRNQNRAGGQTTGGQV